MLMMWNLISLAEECAGDFLRQGGWLVERWWEWFWWWFKNQAGEGEVGVVERAFAQELLPPSACLEELEEEDQLPLASDRGGFVPLGMKPPAGSVERPASCWCY